MSCHKSRDATRSVTSILLKFRSEIVPLENWQQTLEFCHLFTSFPWSILFTYSGRMNVHLTRSLLSTSKRSLQATSRRNLSLLTSRPTSILNTPTRFQKAYASTQADVASEALAELSSSESASSQSQVPVSSAQTKGNNGPNEIPSPVTDAPFGGSEAGVTDWSRSYYGLSKESFPKEVTDVLLAPLNPMDVEIKPGASWLLYVCHVIVFYT